ncbi:MAG: hypothetical protein DMG61_08525, partial [Acidobacteria bacterium]
MKRWLAPLFLVVWTSAVFSQSEPIVPEANPGRPTVSTPATLTPIGYLQFETGAFGATDSPEFSTRISANEVVKLTVHRRLQLLLGFEPFAHTVGQQRATKFGDTFVGAQSVVMRTRDHRSTLSVSLLHQIRDSGAPDVDFGSP